MEPKPSRADEVRALCERLIEGTLAPEEHARLERLVLDNADARRLYVEYMHLHASLRWQAGAMSAAPLAQAMRPRGVRRFAVAASAAAAVLLGIAGVRWQRAHGGAVATLAAARGCRWEGGALPTDEGARLKPGRLRLAEGLATLAF